MDQFNIFSAFAITTAYMLEHDMNFFDDDDLKDAIVFVGKNDDPLSDNDLNKVVTLLRSLQEGFVAGLND